MATKSKNSLTSAQKKRIASLEKKGFKRDMKKSGIESERDGTKFYTFFAQHSMGVALIQRNGKTEGSLGQYKAMY